MFKRASFHSFAGYGDILAQRAREVKREDGDFYREGDNASEKAKAKQKQRNANQKFRPPLQRWQRFGDRVPKVLTLNLGGADSKGAR